MATKPTTPLIAVLQRLRMANTDDTRLAIDALKILLEEGADPNEADSTGLTPLAFFYTDARAIKAASTRESKCWQYKFAIKELARAGANPMAKEGAFFSKASYSYRIEAGTNINPDAPHATESFLACFESLTLSWADNFSSSGWARDSEWNVRTRSSDGKNLLHILWGTTVPRELATLRQQYWQDVSDRAWEMTHRFLNHGADLHAPDKEGRTPAQMLYALLEEGMVPPNPKEGKALFEEVLANIQSRSLQTNTPSTLRTSRMGRL